MKKAVAKILFLFIAILMIPMLTHTIFNPGNDTLAFSQTIYPDQSSDSTRGAGHALLFDGNDYVKIAASNSLNFGADAAFTLEAWIKTSMTGIGEIIRRDDGFGMNRYWFLRLNNGYGQFGIRDAHGKVSVQTGTTFIADNQWHHLAAVREPTTKVLKLFVDGKADAEPLPDNSTGDFMISLPLYLGCLDGSLEFFAGTMDEVRIWNGAKTLTEILGMMHYAVNAATPDLIGNWSFNEGNGQLSADSSANRNAGQLGSSADPDANDPTWVISEAPIHAPEPSVVRVIPASGFRNTEVKVEIIGWGFQPGATVKLVKSGSADILGQATNLVTFNILQAQFYLSGAEPGPWDVAVTNPNGQQLVLTNGFSIKEYVNSAALSFDGNDFVKINNNAGLSFGPNDPFTLEAWVKTGMTGIGQIFIRDDNIGMNRVWNLRVFNGYAQMQLRDTNGRLSELTGNTPIADNKWHHIAGVRDVSADVLRIYVDGKEDAKPIPDVTEGDFYISTPSYIGCLAEKYTFFNGFIDKVRIWKIAKNQTEILGAMYFPELGEDSSLVACWQFNEASGQKTESISYTGSQNTGQLGSSADPDGNDPTWVSSEAPIHAPGPSVARMIPASGFRNTEVKVKVIGWGFEPGATVKLVKSGFPDLLGQGTDLVTFNILQAQLYLSGAEPGAWDVAVTNPDGQQLVLTNGFTVKEYLNSAALSFDGIDDFVQIIKFHGLNFEANESFTLEAWIKTGMTGIGEIIRRDENIGHDRLWNLRVFNGYAQMELNDIFHNLTIQSGNTFIADNNWHHLAAVRDVENDVLRIFVDGKEDADSVPDLTIGDLKLTVPIFIGCLAARYDFFNGQIDEVRIWNVARTEMEILSTMHFPVTDNEPNLVACWRFDEGSGQFAADSAGTGNVGQLGSSPAADGSDPAWVNSDAPVYSPGFTIVRVLPDSAANSGTIQVTIIGMGFHPEAQVRLVRPGYQDIPGEAVQVQGSQLLSARFNLLDRPLGHWDVVVTHPNGESTILKSGFQIYEKSEDVWVNILTRSVYVAGRPQTITIVYGNNSTEDALGVPLIIGGIPRDVKIDFQFDILEPPLPEGSEPIDWDEIPVTIETEDGLEQEIPLLVPVVPAGTTQQIKMTLIAPPNQPPFEVKAWTKSAIFKDALMGDNPAAMDCRNEIAFFILRELIGAVIPEDCMTEAILSLGDIYTRVIKEVYNTFQNPDANRSQVASLVQMFLPMVKTVGVCVGDLWPPARMLKTIAKGISRGFALKGIIDACSKYGGGFFSKTPKLTQVGSMDPNIKIGLMGAGARNYLRGEQSLTYTIMFENLATATAPAQEVQILDTLNLANVDPGTFSLGAIAFGPHQVVPPAGAKELTKDIDLRPATELIVRIAAKLEATSGIIAWQFTSLEPATGQLPEDPLLGFLPPNKNAPEGEGGVIFTVMPRPGLPAATPISNRATIVFDLNPPIATPIWTNAIDNVKPVSQIEQCSAVPNSDREYRLSWSGSDQGSQIMDYAIKVAKDGGSYTTFKPEIADTSAVFIVDEGEHNYRFYSIARDSAGNVEAAPDSFDLKIETRIPTALDAPVGVPGQFSLWQNYPNPFNPSTTINFELPRPIHVTIKIYDVLGRETRTLVDHKYPDGSFTAIWDGRDNSKMPVASGIYFIRMETADFVGIKKLVLMK